MVAAKLFVLELAGLAGGVSILSELREVVQLQGGMIFCGFETKWDGFLGEAVAAGVFLRLWL